MKDLINRLYRNHSLLYKILLFISTTFLIVYLFPKSGKFKYSFEKGKPWQSENYYAPFDFAIKKTDEEIESERKRVIDNAQIYFDIDINLVSKVIEEYESEFLIEFPDSIPIANKVAIKNHGTSILNTLYARGVLDKDYSYEDNRDVVLLNKRTQYKVVKYGSLIPSSEITAFIDSQISKGEFSNYRDKFLSIFYDIINS
mgnify:CR=1 FL=1